MARGKIIPDEVKKANGTFIASRSEQKLLEKAAAKVITGVFLSRIPEPAYKLGPAGRRFYDDLTRMLFEQANLTLVTAARASLAARLHEKIVTLSNEGKFPSASDTTQLQRALDALHIAEKAPNIASPGKTNKFAQSGFSTRRPATR